eukprot:scaffold18917_cov59-Phaeocystis_antarctica.AAC.1
MHSAASSAVAKQPRLTSLPPRHTPAALFAASRPSSDCAKHSAASSAVAKLPRPWTYRAGGIRRSSPSCSRPRAASAPPPAPAAAPPRSSEAAAPLQPSAPPPSPPATVQRIAPPPRRWRSSPGTRTCHRASPAPARVALGHTQRQPLRLRLLPRLLARQTHRRYGSSLRSRLPLRRPRDAQRRLLGGGEAAQVHVLATAPHTRPIGFGPDGVIEVHAEVARLVIGHEQCQPLRLRLRAPHRRSPTRRDSDTSRIQSGSDRSRRMRDSRPGSPRPQRTEAGTAGPRTRGLSHSMRDAYL